ncbi:MAG: PIN domain protein [Elusimicrobiota bacterium]
MKQRVYIDTSVIGGCEDKEFSKWSIRLFNEFRQGLRVAVVSDLTLKEIEKAPENVKKVLLSLPEKNIENVFLTKEAENLAQKYISEGIVNSKHIVDTQHIAISSIERVDVLVSWNFKQIVNLNRIHAFNAVNLKYGYAMLEIRSPREIVYEEGI